MRRPIEIIWKFQCKTWNFGFVIPENRADWGGDFFVHQKNFAGAADGDKVRAQILERISGKKPEAKILEVLTGKAKPQKETLKVVEGVFSWGNGDFGFVDVAGEEDGYFCYGLKKNGASDGDRVRAEIKMYNGKQEAIVVEVLSSQGQVLTGIYADNDRFGFVKPDDKSQDIFIAWSRKAEAINGDKVEVKIVKQGGRRPEGVIVKVLK